MFKSACFHLDQIYRTLEFQCWRGIPTLDALLARVAVFSENLIFFLNNKLKKYPKRGSE